MLSDNLKEHASAVAVEAFDVDAVTGGKFDFNELTLDIARGKIVSVCGFLKYDQQFVRLSGVTAVDRYPAEPRFEIVYHLHSVERNDRVRLRPFRHQVSEPSRPAPHSDAG
jgi:NADH-quinone oxidoreductase subunit C